MEKIFDCPDNIFVIETNNSKSVLFKIKKRVLEKEFTHGYIYDTTSQKFYLAWGDGGTIEHSFEKGKPIVFSYGDKFDKYISIIIYDRIINIEYWEKDDVIGTHKTIYRRRMNDEYCNST